MEKWSAEVARNAADRRLLLLQEELLHRLSQLEEFVERKLRSQPEKRGKYVRKCGICGSSFLPGSKAQPFLHVGIHSWMGATNLSDAALLTNLPALQFVIIPAGQVLRLA